MSAALALGSTSAAAQEAAPGIVLPPPVASAPMPQPAAPAPTIVLPPAASAPAEPAAAAEPAPRAERPAARRAATPAPRAADPVAPEAANAPAPVTDAPAATTETMPAPPMEMPVAAQLDAPVAATPQPDSVRSDIDVPDEIIAASILGVIGLGIAGFVATRRRRRVEVVADDVYETERAYVADAPATGMPAERAVAPQDRTVTAPVATPAYSVPQGPAASGEDRERLLAQMVAAAPDEANPFTSAKARRRRARIILQSRENDQRQQADAPFDWRTYRSPASSDPASPPMVDAW